MGSSTGSPLIFRIANETLADIFLLNTGRTVGHWDTRRWVWIVDHDPRLTTRYSSQVCQRWRDVALGYSTLWSRIIHFDQDPLPWIDELLRRSHSTTLEFGQVNWILQVGSPQLPVLSRAVCHAQRLKTINISAEREAWEGICEGILQIQAPNLEYFHLAIFFIRDPLVFTGTLFSNNAPCLRRLHLRHCLVDLSSSTLLNLTELSLQGITSGAPTVDAWLAILEDMPLLRWLTIVDVISTPFPTCHLPTPCLPNLSCLSIRANFPECMALVNHIACPPLGMLRLNCIDATSGPKIKQLSSVLEKRLSLWRIPTKADRNFVFKCLEGNLILIGNSSRIGCGWNASESEGVNEVLEDPVLSIQLFFTNFEEMETSALPFLLVFSHVFTTVFCLTFWLDSATEHMFNRLFGALLLFNNVEEIDLLENSPTTFLPPLQVAQPRVECSIPSTTALPSLRTIRLTEIKFKGPAFDILVSYLQYRQQLLAPIGMLEIIDSSVSRAQRDVLKQFTGLDLQINSCYESD